MSRATVCELSWLQTNGEERFIMQIMCEAIILRVLASVTWRLDEVRLSECDAQGRVMIDVLVAEIDVAKNMAYTL